ncbi:MAG: hypothetical protein EOP04_12060 [Proteobacteria bacterium]|nr:MAG: hypothetical protein EOP04_12060 [Pseudomonadota bacterium]
MRNIIKLLPKPSLTLLVFAFCGCGSRNSVISERSVYFDLTANDRQFRVTTVAKCVISGNNGSIEVEGPMLMVPKSVGSIDHALVRDDKLSRSWKFGNERLQDHSIYRLEKDGKITLIDKFEDRDFSVEFTKNSNGTEDIDKHFLIFEAGLPEKVMRRKEAIDRLVNF